MPISVWSRVRARIRGFFHRDAVAGEIREELEFHVRMRAEDYERAGAPPQMAIAHARQGSETSRSGRTLAMTSEEAV